MILKAGRLIDSWQSVGCSAEWLGFTFDEYRFWMTPINSNLYSTTESANKLIATLLTLQNKRLPDNEGRR